MITLEDELEGVFIELGVSTENRESVSNYLSILKAKDQASYEHSIRVGLLGERIAITLSSPFSSKERKRAMVKIVTVERMPPKIAPKALKILAEALVKPCSNA